MHVRRLHFVTALACAVLVAGCATPPPAPEAPPAGPSIGELLDAAIAGDHRAPANVARDAWRHPKETLTFFGLTPDMTVKEIWPVLRWRTSPNSRLTASASP